MKNPAPTPNLTHLLNKVEALLASGAGDRKELAAWVGTEYRRIQEWVIERRYPPGGEVTCKLQMWTEMKYQELAATGPGSKSHIAYAREFARVSKEHPSETT